MEKACKLAMVRCHSIQAEEANEWGITGEQLEKEIIKVTLGGGGESDSLMFEEKQIF